MGNGNLDAEDEGAESLITSGTSRCTRREYGRACNSCPRLSPRSESFDSPTFAREHTRTPVAFLVDLVHNKKKLLFVRYAMCREAQAEEYTRVSASTVLLGCRVDITCHRTPQPCFLPSRAYCASLTPTWGDFLASSIARWCLYTVCYALSNKLMAFLLIIAEGARGVAHR